MKKRQVTVELSPRTLRTVISIANRHEVTLEECVLALILLSLEAWSENQEDFGSLLHYHANKPNVSKEIERLWM